MNKILFAFLLLPYFVFSQNNNIKQFQTENSFIENKGQFDGRNWDSNSKIKYAIDYNSAQVFFTEKGLTYRFDKIIKNPELEGEKDFEGKREGKPERTNISELIQINFLGANPNVKIIAENVNSSHYSYNIYQNGNHKTVKNINNIRGYKKITYRNIYNKIDLEYIIKEEGGFEYSFILKPGADASKIKMKYSSAHTSVGSENIEYFLEANEMRIKTSLSEVTEHVPFSFYSDSNQKINSSFKFEDNILSFNIDNYDNSKAITIDPWVISPNFNTSTAVWEVETDASGNVFAIGGETYMELRKYNSGGTQQWAYVTPWDTANVWLGTLATDASGTSYITSGTTPEMERIDNAGNMIWHVSGGGGFSSTSEWWSITFNCDKTRLIVGGTYVPGALSFDYYASIFNMDLTNGDVLGHIELAYTNIGGFGNMPEEVRSIAPTNNSKYVFLTHKQVGIINQDIGACPNIEPDFQVSNQEQLAYKCENYLPETQNGGGLKALIANDNYFYTHTGEEIRQWDVTNGALLNTAALPSGSSSSALGNTVVHNSGLAVDDAGNVYAGSDGNVVKFDANLNVLQQTSVSFSVYDVSVNSNGEVVVCGAEQDNSAASRNGRIQSLDMGSGGQFVATCCDVNICPPDTVCDDDPAFNIDVSSPGGTFSGTGIIDANAGTFDPSVAGVGVHTITYTKPCGSETVEVMVSSCEPIEVCDDGTNYVASGGMGVLTWYDWETITITTETECTSCGGTWNPGFPPLVPASCDISTCSAWVQIATGTTLDPSLINSWPIMVSDGTTDLTFNSASEIAACSPCTNPTLSEAHIDLTCAGDNSGMIDLTVTPGSGSTYNIQWNGPSSFSSTSEDIMSLEAGIYTVTVTDASNASCDATLTIIVNDGAPTDDASFTLTDYCENAPNSATITGTAGGSFAFNPAPSNGETINSSTGEITGGIGGNTYTIEYTTTGTCPASSTETVTVNANPLPTITGSLTFCTGLTTTLDAGSYNSWVWNPNGETTQTITVGTAGTYVVTVTDANGCTGTTQVDVVEASSLSPTISGVLSICSGASTTLDAGAGYAGYTWDPNGEVTQTITVNTAGTYSVTVVDAGGCTGSAQVSVVANTNPTPSITGSLSFCAGGSTTLDAGAGYADYAWTPSATTQTITATTAGNYSVTVTDANGCTGTDDVDVTIASGLSPSITGVLTICSGNSTTLDAGAGYADYIWAPNSETTQTINVTSSGTYSVTVSDASGCTGSDQVVVNVDNNPVPNITGTLAICSGASTTLDAGAGFASYLWSPGGETTQTITVTQGGTYTVGVANANGCTGTDQVVVTENQNPTPNITGNLTICQGNSTILDAGTGYASYIWTQNGEVTQTINVSTAGTYEVSVTTAAGCSGTVSVNVNVVAGLSVSISGNLNICGGSTTTLDAGAGYPHYIWNTNDGTQTITTGTAGTYSVTVSDDNGCSATDAVTIDVSDLTLVTSGDQEICKGVSTTISAALSGGGTPPFTYSWDNGGTTSDITVSPASETTYTVYVTDAMGCVSNTEVVVVTVVPGVNLTINANKDTVCPGDPVLITSLITGGKPPYTITNDDGTVVSVNDIVYPYQTQTFTYTVTDACESIDIDMVDVNTYPVPPLNIQADVLQGCEPLAVHFMVPDYTEGFTYQWSFINGSISDIANGANTLHIFDHFGTYDVGVNVVTDDGCKNSLLINDLIDVYRKPDAHFITNPQTVSIINPQVNFSNLSQWADHYIWSFGDGDSSNITNPYHSYQEISSYTVNLVAVTSQGCIDSAMQTIVVVEEPTLYVPTAFSPDGDGINDLFIVQANGMDLDNYNIKIYDRWGELIFESDDLYKSWDGTAKNKTKFVENGTYVWLVTVKDVNGIETQQSGTVTVIR